MCGKVLPKDLFNSIESAFSDYTSEAFDAYEKEDVDGLLKDRLLSAIEKVEEKLEGEILVSVAVFLGQTRLIDNFTYSIPDLHNC